MTSCVCVVTYILSCPVLKARQPYGGAIVHIQIVNIYCTIHYLAVPLAVFDRTLDY